MMSTAAKNVSPGNLTDRFELKNRLQCKSFRWYLDAIYPEGILLRQYLMMGDVCRDQYSMQSKC